MTRNKADIGNAVPQRQQVACELEKRLFASVNEARKALDSFMGMQGSSFDGATYKRPDKSYGPVVEYQCGYFSFLFSVDGGAGQRTIGGCWLCWGQRIACSARKVDNAVPMPAAFLQGFEEYAAIESDSAAKSDFVRTMFFPAWDRERRWKIVQAHDLNGAQGHCDHATRTISILEGISGDRLTVLLVHEIAHAVVGPHHGKCWLKRIEQAALQAEQLHGPLAALLREEIEGYKNALVLTAAYIYNSIADVVWHNANTTFFQAIDFVRQDFGMSRLDFLTRFSSAKAIYDVERKDALVSAAAKRQFLRAQFLSDDQKS